MKTGLPNSDNRTLVPPTRLPVVIGRAAQGAASSGNVPAGTASGERRQGELLPREVPMPYIRRMALQEGESAGSDVVRPQFGADARVSYSNAAGIKLYAATQQLLEAPAPTRRQAVA
jgi:hypothetical protein